MKIILILVSTLLALNISSAEISLDQQLDNLRMPTNQAPGAVSQEQLYSIQSRYTPLGQRHELSISGAKDFQSDGYLTTNQIGLSYRYHFDNKWSFRGSYVRVFNSLNNSGEILLNEKKLVSDSDYLISQTDVGAEYNLFYGKFRMGLDQIFYFDQYIGLSAGIVEKRRGIVPVVGLDIGLAFWANKKMGLRVGLKNNVFSEKNGLDEEAYTRNMIGYTSISYLFGKE